MEDSPRTGGNFRLSERCNVCLPDIDTLLIFEPKWSADLVRKDKISLALAYRRIDGWIIEDHKWNQGDCVQVNVQAHAAVRVHFSGQLVGAPIRTSVVRAAQRFRVRRPKASYSASKTPVGFSTRIN